MNSLISWLQTTFQDNVWIIQIFTIALLTAFVHLFESLVYKRVHQKLKKTNNVWDDSFVRALHRPLTILIWVIGISIAAQIAASIAKNNYLFSLIGPLRSVSILVLLTWFVIRFIHFVEEALQQPRDGKKPVDKTTLHAVSQLLRISVLITATLVGMQMFDIPVSGILAFGGIGGAGVAFAAKDLLGNFFGGLMIYLDRPFSVGDWIRSPDRQIEGTVEYIGWRLTRIRTFDKRPLYVPNGIFSVISVENPSRMTNRRIKTLVGVRYDDAAKVATLTTDIEKMLREHPEIDTTMTLIVNLVEFAPSALNIMVYTFTKTTNWVRFQAIQEEVFLKIIEIIEGHGAECAFPTQTVHIPEPVAMQSS